MSSQQAPPTYTIGVSRQRQAPPGVGSMGQSSAQSSSGTYESTLQSFGLTAQHISGDGNCLFRAVAKQLKDDVDHIMLRKLTCAQGRKMSKYYSLFFSEGEAKFLDLINCCDTPGEWESVSKYLNAVLTILQHTIERQMVVVLVDGSTLMYPPKSQFMRDSSIVIINTDSHFTATAKDGKCEREELRVPDHTAIDGRSRGTLNGGTMSSPSYLQLNDGGQGSPLSHDIQYLLHSSPVVSGVQPVYPPHIYGIAPSYQQQTRTAALNVVTRTQPTNDHPIQIQYVSAYRMPVRPLQGICTIPLGHPMSLRMDHRSHDITSQPTSQDSLYRQVRNRHTVGDGSVTGDGSGNGRYTVDDLEINRRINNQLLAMGRCRRPIVGNGNCMFEAMSRQICGQNHLTLRKLACDYGERYKTKYESCVNHTDNKSYDEMLKDMRNDGEWITALGDLMPILVAESTGRHTVVVDGIGDPKFHPESRIEVGEETVVIVRRFDHYDTTDRIDDRTLPSVPQPLRPTPPMSTTQPPMTAFTKSTAVTSYDDEDDSECDWITLEDDESREQELITQRQRQSPSFSSSLPESKRMRQDKNM